MNQEILTADQVADLLRIKKSRLYSLVRQRRIPFIVIGERQYRFSQPAIRKWLDGGGFSDVRDRNKDGKCPQCGDDLTGSRIRLGAVYICGDCLEVVCDEPGLLRRYVKEGVPA